MKIFIGSSNEAVAQGLVDKVAMWIESKGHTPIPWNKEGLFLPGSYTLHRLQTIATEVNAAVLFFTEDDKTWYRDEVKVSPRDNVLIEFGLFVGRSDSTRTIICKKGNPKFATDLVGMTFIDLNKETRAKIEFEAWLDAVKDASSIRGTRLVTCYTNKYSMNDSNSYWSNLRRNAKKKLIIMGDTNKSWISRDPDENHNYAKQIIEMIQKESLVALISGKSALKSTQFFVKKYIVEQVNEISNLEERKKVKKLLEERFKYCINSHINYRAVLADEKIVILPNLVDVQFRDESLVLELNESSHPVEYGYYFQDLNRVISSSFSKNHLKSIYEGIEV